MSETFHIITTGGTIDKEYDPVSEQFSFRNHSKIPALLNKAEIRGYTFKALMRKDSLDVNAQDLERIAKEINLAKSSRIIIVHGLSTIIRTASYLEERLKKPKIVILTGSINPITYQPVEPTANLSLAIAAATTFNKSGVFIAAHGRILVWNKVKKDLSTGLLEPK